MRYLQAAALIAAGCLFLAAQFLATTLLTAQGVGGAQFKVFGSGILILSALIVLIRRRPVGAAPNEDEPQRKAEPMETTPHLARVTSQLRTVFEQANVHARASVYRGPFTLTYEVKPTGDLVAGMRALRSPDLQQALQVATRSTVRVTPSPSGVLFQIELPRELHQTPRADRLARVASWGRLPVGVDDRMQPIFLDQREHGSIFWIAPPRRGKTTSMRSMLYLMCATNPDLKFAIIGLASKLQQDWLPFATVDGCLGLISEPAEIVACLAWAAAAMDAGRPGPLVLVIDDMTNISGLAPEAATYIDALATAGAGLGYHLLVGTHTAGSRRSTGGALVQSTMTAKLLYKAADNTTAARSSGQGNAATGMQQLSGHPGDALFDDGRGLVRVATARVDDAAILGLPQHAGALARPWRQRMITDHGHRPQRTEPRERAIGSATPRRAGISDRDRRDRAWATVPEGMFPIAPARPLADAEAATLRRLYVEAPFTPSGLADLVFAGGRNPKRVGFIRQALAPLDLANEEAEMYAELAILVLEAGNHPRQQEALSFLAAIDQINVGGK